MSENYGRFGLIVGAFVVVMSIFFVVGGGGLGGKKTVEKDADLPPLASEKAPEIK